MPETFDIQRAFDDLARDVSRVAGPGDVDRPVRRARRRRATAGAVMVGVVAMLGITVAQLAGTDPRGSDPGYVDTRAEESPGAERRQRLLGLLPAEAPQVTLVDVPAFTGEPGLGLSDPIEGQLMGYVTPGFLQLAREPFMGLLLPELVTYAGTGTVDLFLIDRPADRVTGTLVRAGWDDDGGVLVPGAGISRIDARLAPHISVTDDGGLTLVAIAGDRSDLPDLDDPQPPAAGSPADRLVQLGGAAGIAPGFEAGPCMLQAATLAGPTEAIMVFPPPPDTSPDDVTVDDLSVPEGVASIDTVEGLGDLVRAEVTIADPGGPLELLRRYGLPGTEFC